MKNYRRADLHMHSIFSDGVSTPEVLAQKAKENGVELISLTDHDTFSGAERMRKAASDLGMDFVIGSEISSDFGNVQIHIVGLDFEPENDDLKDLLRFTQKARRVRAEKIAERLEHFGIKGAWEGVLKEVTNPDLIARPHFAAWLVREGYVKSISEAFEKWLGRNRQAYVRREPVAIEAAVKAILGADGVPVLAHPGRYPLKDWEFDEVLKKFTDAGGHAIEVTTGSHRPGQSLIFADLAREKKLWVSTGSDYHNPHSVVLPGLQGDLPKDLEPVWRHFRSAS